MRMFSRRVVGYLVVATSLALPLTGPSLAQSQGQEVTIRDAKELVESAGSRGYDPRCERASRVAAVGWTRYCCPTWRNLL